MSGDRAGNFASRALWRNSYNMPGIRRAAPAQRNLALKAGIVISTRALCPVTSNDNYSGADSNIDASRVGTSVVPGLS